jgi:hypothetical protein
MNREQWTSRMHAVLDGAATEAEIRDLYAHLDGNAEAADEFTSWKAMFDGLDHLSDAHPPEGLVASITGALPPARRMGGTTRASDEQIILKRDQLFSGTAVISSGNTQTTRRPIGFKSGFRSITGWLMPATSRESNMNTQRKILAGGAAAVVALGVAVMLSGYPPKSNDVVGTVVPAERYRAPQSGAEAVKLGEQAATTSSTATVEATGVAAANAEAAAQADRLGRLNDAERTAELSQLDKVMKASSQAEKTAELSQLDKVMKSSQAERTAEMVQLDKVMKASQADKAAELTQLDRIMRADKSAERFQLDKVMKASQADKAAELTQLDRIMKASQAERMAELSQLDKVMKANQADKAAELNQLDKVMKASQADRIARLNNAEKSAELSQADRIARQSSAEKSAELTQADRQMKASQADKVANEAEANRRVP